MLFSANVFSEYETYLQVDKSTVNGKYFVLFSISNTDVTMKGDGSTIHAVISPGESVSETLVNDFYPEMVYDLKISIENTEKLFVKVAVSVKKEEAVIYKNQYKTRISSCSIASNNAFKGEIHRNSVMRYY